MTPTELLTKHQAELIHELRELDATIARAQTRRAKVRAELERIYPEARTLSVPPPTPSVVLSVWNYTVYSRSASVTITAKGRKAVTDVDPTLNSTDFTILAVLFPRNTPADVTKLLALPELNDPTSKPKRRLNLLHRSAYINIEFTPLPVQVRS